MTAEWTDIREALRGTLDSGAFKVWIAPLQGEVDGTRVRLAAPNAFVADWIRDRLSDTVGTVSASLMGVSAETVRVEVEVQRDGGTPVVRKRRLPPPSPQAAVQAAVPAVPQAAPVAPAREQGVLPFARPAPSFRLAPASWRYRFEDFVVGPTNEMAVAAAKDLCSQATSTETLFVSSASGLGKTHLVQAMGALLCTSARQATIAYMTAEDFASRFVAALRNKSVDDFKAMLRGVDVLLLEDVHFLQGKEKMQDEALATIKSLQARGSRIVMTSSFTPRELRNVDSQLVSHFCSGLLATMEKPTLDMRRDILDRKAHLHQVILPEPVTDLLAERLSTDVRQLESCLNNLIFKARHLNRQISVEMALDMLGQYAQVNSVLDVEELIRLACDIYGLKIGQLSSRSRRHDCVLARNTIYYLARKHTDLSLKEIGDKFNRRHSTVIKGITSLEREMHSASSRGRQIANTVALIERNAGVLS